jgi:DNA processing protein
MPAPVDAALSPARAAELRLSLADGIGPRLRQALRERFPSAEAVFQAAPSELREVSGIGPKLVAAIRAAREMSLDELLTDCQTHRVRIMLSGDDDYPTALAKIHDPPGTLFLRGDVQPNDALALAIVGTRHATAYGLAQAERLAGGLARAGYVVVSGLARGIDGAAHRGALAANGRTIAVLGSGVLDIYPPEHVDLAGRIAQQGAVLSEAHPRAPALGGMFPQRNRIITGLSLGVIVVEASDNSGALISARHAMEQGREVFAVPGRVDSRVSRGCHRLIRDGAKLVETVDDVLEELGPLTAPAQDALGTTVHHPAELQLNEQERAVLDAIRVDPTPLDEVAAVSKVPVPRVLATISVLEMRRLIRRVSGNQVLRL